MSGVMCAAQENGREGAAAQMNSGGEVPKVSSWTQSLDTKFRHITVSSGWGLFSSN